LEWENQDVGQASSSPVMCKTRALVRSAWHRSCTTSLQRNSYQEVLAMMDRMLERSEWKVYFDFMSRFLAGKSVEMEVAGLDVGDQIEERWTLLDGLSYEPQSDVFVVHTALLDHMIFKPQQIYITETDGSLSAVGIRDGQDRLQIIKLRRPVMLEAMPAPVKTGRGSPQPPGEQRP
jgi:hypothetical protein